MARKLGALRGIAGTAAVLAALSTAPLLAQDNTPRVGVPIGLAPAVTSPSIYSNNGQKGNGQPTVSVPLGNTAATPANTAPPAYALGPQQIASGPSTVSVGSITSPMSTLTDARVSDRFGTYVGDIQYVILGISGTASKVAVKLANSPQIVQLKVDHMIYDPSKRTVMADMTSKQIKGFAAGATSGNGSLSLTGLSTPSLSTSGSAVTPSRSTSSAAADVLGLSNNSASINLLFGTPSTAASKAPSSAPNAPATAAPSGSSSN